MGFGLPAALGAAVTFPDVPVIDIDGDGSFVMNVQVFFQLVETLFLFCRRSPTDNAPDCPNLSEVVPLQIFDVCPR